MGETLKPRWQFWFCYCVNYLDYLPRYGRLYPMNSETKTSNPGRWYFQRHGHWGISILQRISTPMFWRYIDELIERGEP